VKVNCLIPPSILASTVTDLFATPGLPLESKETLITPSFPGPIGSFVHSGVVQPQEGFTFLITSGLLPSFLNLKVWETTSPSLILPKLWLSSVKVILVTGSLASSFPSAGEGSVPVNLCAASDCL
jgi:hypothetical protein